MIGEPKRTSGGLCSRDCTCTSCWGEGPKWLRFSAAHSTRCALLDERGAKKGLLASWCALVPAWHVRTGAKPFSHHVDTSRTQQKAQERSGRDSECPAASVPEISKLGFRFFLGGSGVQVPKGASTQQHNSAPESLLPIALFQDQRACIRMVQMSRIETRDLLSGHTQTVCGGRHTTLQRDDQSKNISKLGGKTNCCLDKAFFA